MSAAGKGDVEFREMVSFQFADFVFVRV